MNITQKEIDKVAEEFNYQPYNMAIHIIRLRNAIEELKQRDEEWQQITGYSNPEYAD